MAKKPVENCPIYVIRKGNALYGEMEMDRDALRQYHEGDRIRVDLRTGRVPSRLRFYWAYLADVVSATECAPHAKALHSLVKLRTGYTDDIIMGGFVIKVPSTISFHGMDEPTFETFLEGAIRFIAEQFGVMPEQFERKAS